MDGVVVHPAGSSDLGEWSRMRHALWVDCSPDEHREECVELLGSLAQQAFIARAGDGSAIGFAEAAQREEYVNGTEDCPVAFLEGLYVSPAWQRRGVAKRLLRAVEDWARARGLGELASDTDWENPEGIGFHLASGFQETERVIYFSKRLDDRAR